MEQQQQTVLVEGAEQRSEQKRKVIEVVISAPLCDELETAAHESKIPVITYLAEVLECHAAERRLPKVKGVPHSTGPRMTGQAAASAEDHGFPWPADCYKVSGISGMK